LIILLTLSPLFIRNWLFTGNPFFPIFGDLFKSAWDYQSLSGGYVQWRNARRPLALLLPRLQLILQRDFFVLVLPLVVLILGVLKSWGNSFRLLLASTFSYVLFLVVVGSAYGTDDGTISLRFLGPGLVLALGSAAIGSFLVLDKIGERTSRNFLQAILALVFLVVSAWHTQMPIRDLDVLRKDMGRITWASRLFAMGGATKAWLRLNSKPGDLIVSTGDNQIYYLSHLRVTVADAQPFLDGSIRKFLDLREVLAFLYSMNVKYIVDTNYFETKFWNILSYRINEGIDAYPSANLFEFGNSRVIDPFVLLQEIEQACVVRAPFPTEPMALFI
ncbi:MAG: hypothetical protein ABI041_07245, partial [Bdellovibrionia bacterium]